MEPMGRRSQGKHCHGVARGKPALELIVQVLTPLQNDAGKMLHEMMHINMITRDRPHSKIYTFYRYRSLLIHDAVVDQKWNARRVYTAPYVADWVASGAKTSDVVQNADSYTQFVNGRKPRLVSPDDC